MKKLANRGFWLGMLPVAAALLFGMAVVGCDNSTDGDGKKITITGITGKTGSAIIYAVSNFDDEDGIVAAGSGNISGNSVTFSLLNANQAPWTGSGSYYLMLGFDQDDSEYYYTNGQTITAEEDENFYTKLPTYTITSTTSTIAFNLFREISIDDRPALTGTVTIDNTSPQVDDILTALYSGGNGTGAATWQWIQGESTSVGTDSDTYTVTADDEGKTIKVQVSFADQKGSKISAATDIVTTYNRPVLTGTVTIDNTSPQVGGILTAAYSGGNGTGTETWQWVRGESTSIGTDSDTYTVVEADWGQTIKVRVSFADQIDSVTSTATAAVQGGELNLTKWGKILEAIQNDASFDGTLDLSGYTRTANSSGVLNSSGNFDTSTGGNIGKDKIKNIILPDAAASIASLIFSSLTSYTALESVTGANITTINVTTFMANTTLKSVVLPKVTNIVNDAFSDCTGLETAQFAAATTIGNNAFKSCTKLETIDFPEAAVIGTNAFEKCTGLTGTITFPKVTNIGGSAFLNCVNIDDVKFPAAATVGSSAFEECEKLASVDIPSVTMIGAGAFTNVGKQFQGTFSASPAFKVHLGKQPPNLGTAIFGNTTSTGAKKVAIYIPDDANVTIYGASPMEDGSGSVSGTDTSDIWANGFRGAGWNGTNVITAALRNSNVSISMYYEYGF